MMLLKLLPLLLLASIPSNVFSQGQKQPSQNQNNHPQNNQPNNRPINPPNNQPNDNNQPPVVNMNEILRYLCGPYVCPRFEINLNLSTPDYDVREYPEMKYVMVDAPPPDANGTFDWNIMREMFQNLRDYFEGNNEFKLSINLTAPSLKYLKLEGDQREPVLDYTAFYLPVSVSPAPKPLNPKVKVVTMPAFKAYIRIFYGCPEVDDLWRINIEALRAAMKQRIPNHQPSPYYFSASYGPQAGLYCAYRRNEIWIVPSHTYRNPNTIN